MVTRRRRITRFIDFLRPTNGILLLPEGEKLSFAPGGFDLALEFDHQLANTRLAHRFNPTQRFIEHAPLLLRPIRLAHYASQLAVVKTGTRWTHSFHHFTLNCQGHRGNARVLDRARGQSNRLMTEERRGNQQSRLDFVTVESLDQARNGLSDQTGRVRDMATKTPKHRIQLTDDAIAFKFEEPGER